MRPPALRTFIDTVIGTQPWPDECVIFPGRRQPNGYGRVSIDGRYERAHIYACRLAHGARPVDKTDAAHRCGEHMCVNPRHLYWATRAENEHDKQAHGRSNRARSNRLTQAQVDLIRQWYTAGGSTQRELADHFGVSLMTINDIVNHRTWVPF